MKTTNVLLTTALSAGVVLGATLAYTGQLMGSAQAADASVPTNGVTNQEVQNQEHEPIERESIEHEVHIFVDDGYDPFKTAADQLGLSLDELFEKLEEGKSIAEVAQENNIDPQQIVDAIAEQDAKWLDEMIANGEINAEDATELRTDLSKEAAAMVNGDHSVVFGDCGDGLFYDGEHAGDLDGDMAFYDIAVDYEAIVAQALDISVDELMVALEGGKTVTEIAKEKGVDPQVVVDALNTAHAQWIDEAVATGEVTAEDADSLRTELTELVTKTMDEPYEIEEDIDIISNLGMMSAGSVDMMGSGIHLDVAAQTLDMDEGALFDALIEGKTIATLAEEKGVSTESIIDNMTAAAREEIAEFVQNGWPEGMPCGGPFFEDELFFSGDLNTAVFGMKIEDRVNGQDTD